MTFAEESVIWKKLAAEFRVHQAANDHEKLEAVERRMDRFLDSLPIRST
jgi:hypothetical protein